MKVAVIGATGMVGNVMLRVLEERNFPVTELIAVATKKSEGKKVLFGNKEHSLITVEQAVEMQPDIALFSAGSETSKNWAGVFAERGTTVIDNSSEWRMKEGIKLIVPEINASVLGVRDKIIANPNCSTIQMVMVLAPLHQKYGIDRIVVSTYQSVSGTGQKAMLQLEDERRNLSGGEKVYAHNIDLNCLPHCDVFLDNNYTKEEMKLVNETRKILNEPALKITATAVRVPVIGGHSEAVNITFKKDFDVKDILKDLQRSSGITVYDDPAKNIYPTPLFAAGKDEVFVGRIRRDESNANSLNLWVVADNLRKGAATNAVQIAEYLVKQKLIDKAVVI